MIINESDIYPYKTADLADKDCLVIAPHPDDESIGCGGSIARHIKQGSAVTVVFLTSGDKGDFMGIFGPGYPDRRRDSALNALSILGVKEYEFWGFRDRELYTVRDILSDRIEKRIRSLRPQLIYVPSPYEAHPDHRVAAFLGWEVCRKTNIPVCFYEALIPLYPNVLVDISEEFRIKEAAIRCYTTELHYNDYADKMAGLNRFRSATLPASVRYAEAFVFVDGTNHGETAVQLMKNFMHADAF